jgi:two-component system cell cycle sensor histidine kinase/response regulator CckA
VKQSGASISVYSEAGEGTTFRIYFPLVGQDVVQEATPVIAEHPEALRGYETILLVEDEESVRRFAAMALEAKGYRVLQAANGVEALKTLESSAVALVITDVIMPDMGGVALARRLRERTPAPPILFMSGHAESALPRRDDAGDEATLQKPFSPFELASKVREVLASQRARPT